MLEILEQLNATRSRLLSVLNGLSNDQLNYKPDDNTWSISQIVQHIVTVEDGSAQMIRIGLTQEPNFIPTDIPLEKLILDRSNKVNAPERLHPPTDSKTMSQLKEILNNSREKFVDTLNGIEDITLLEKTAPPRSHPVFGQLSTGQWIRAARLHEERHIQQIEELKERLSSI